MTGPADCGHVTIDSRALALLVSPASLRRQRALWRGHPAIYESLLAITVMLGFAGESQLAIPAPASDAGYMTASEYAQAAGITPQAVRLACRQGRIRAAKRGGVWLIEGAELIVRQTSC